METDWEDEFPCWNTLDGTRFRLKADRYCEVCGANKPIETHETWCPNEADRAAKDDDDFWYGLDPSWDDECCTCTVCTNALADAAGNEEWNGSDLTEWLEDPGTPEPYHAPTYTTGHPPRNPKFDAVLEQMRSMHNRKNQDYAEADNPYSNFEFAAKIGGCSVDTVFRTLIGVKLARLDELLKGKTANFESISDTQLDLAIYSALWTSYGR